MTERTVIGDISILFRRRSEFLYKALTNLDCQAIRKQEFHELLEKYSQFGAKLKAKAFTRYNDIIRKPLMEHQK
jgi:hypothetical protein